MLGARNSSQIDDFCTGGRRENLDLYYINESYSDLPRQNIRNNSDRIILFRQSLGEIRCIYFDIAAFDMRYSEFEEMCRRAWSESFSYLCVGLTEKNGGKYSIFNESKNTYIDCICKNEAF